MRHYGPTAHHDLALACPGYREFYSDETNSARAEHEEVREFAAWLVEAKGAESFSDWTPELFREQWAEWRAARGPAA